MQPQRMNKNSKNYKKNFFCVRSDIKILNLSPNELKLIAKSRGIKGYENKSEYDLIKKLSEPKTKISLSRKKIKDIKKFFSEL